LKHGNRLLQLYDEFINQNRSIEDVSRQYAETLISELPSIQEIAGDLDVDANQLYQKELIVNAKRKLIRVSNLEKEKGKLESDNLLENIETIFKSSFYMVVRQLHNMCKAKNGYYPSAYFLFIRNFAYSGMFRYNAKGGFNVPYGGIAYNSKNFYKKITYLQSDALSALLSRTDIENMDFEDFLTTRAPNKNDFVFLDPPYDTTFSTYAMNPFCEQDQKRLAKYLISNCKAKWMLVIKNTELISMLYDHPSLYITSFDKKYQVSFMNRNNKNAKHLIIRNYPNGE
jgi:DNA adenine methylase